MTQTNPATWCWYCRAIDTLTSEVYRGQKFLQCSLCGATTTPRLPVLEMPKLSPVTLAHIRWMKELALRGSSGNLL